MMIFREHWVLSMYALSFVFGIFFLCCLLLVLYKDGNILKA